MTVNPARSQPEEKAFTPALGLRALTPLYDLAIAATEQALECLKKHAAER